MRHDKVPIPVQNPFFRALCPVIVSRIMRALLFALLFGLAALAGCTDAPQSSETPSIDKSEDALETGGRALEETEPPATTAPPPRPVKPAPEPGREATLPPP